MPLNETAQTILADLRLPETPATPALELLSATDSRALKDLKLNINAVLKSNHLSRKETLLLALAAAMNEKHSSLIEGLTTLARAEEATDAELAEIVACVSVMSANNVLYRFRHYMHENDTYAKSPAGMRMSVMMNPVLGKEFFELVSLAVSALNGCERCVQSHEQSVKDHGATEARIFDAIRLVSVLKSACVVL
jgi:alkyl hydroperoxide reductase subunit D